MKSSSNDTDTIHLYLQQALQGREIKIKIIADPSLAKLFCILNMKNPKFKYNRERIKLS